MRNALFLLALAAAPAFATGPCEIYETRELSRREVVEDKECRVVKSPKLAQKSLTYPKLGARDVSYWEGGVVAKPVWATVLYLEVITNQCTGGVSESIYSQGFRTQKEFRFSPPQENLDESIDDESKLAPPSSSTVSGLFYDFLDRCHEGRL